MHLPVTRSSRGWTLWGYAQKNIYISWNQTNLFASIKDTHLAESMNELLKGQADLNSTQSNLLRILLQALGFLFWLEYVLGINQSRSLMAQSVLLDEEAVSRKGRSSRSFRQILLFCPAACWCRTVAGRRSKRSKEQGTGLEGFAKISSGRAFLLKNIDVIRRGRRHGAPACYACMRACVHAFFHLD